MKQIQIDPEFKRMIPPLTAEEYAQLEANIVANGCREPLSVWAGHGILLDGHNRLEICRKHGIEYGTIDYILPDREAAEDWIDANQLGRRNLPPDSMSLLRGRRLNRAKKRVGRPRKLYQSDTISGSTAAQLAKEHGVSTATINRDGAFAAAVDKVKVVDPEIEQKILTGEGPTRQATIKAAKLLDAKPEIAAEVLDNRKPIKQVIAEEKRERKQAVAAAIEAEPAPLPIGPFRVIAVDPPWKYGNRADDDSHRGRNQYPDMTVDEICALPVADLAHDDCVLWLWTTNAFMREAYQCLDAWGFTAKTILTWDKELIGLGDYLRNQTEHCILATKGKPVLTLTNQRTIIREARREHSRKPEAFYALVESLCPGAKLEMFARQQRQDWQAWGAEANEFNGAA